MALPAESPGRVIARFAREGYEAVQPEIGPLLAEHWQEVAHYQDIPLSVDWERYQQAEIAGGLRIYTARDEDGFLIGYVIYLLAPNLHYKQSFQAFQDVLFLLPEWRRGGLGKSMLEYAEADLKIAQVQVIYQHIKAKDAALLGRFLRQRGYEKIDEIFGKRLDR